MEVTSRELVLRTLGFQNPGRVPRDLWILPWATLHEGEAVECLVRDFQPDIRGVDPHLREKPPTQGDPYKIGEFTDEWGCVFKNAQDGVIGQVKQPRIENWAEDVRHVHFPREWLTVGLGDVNRDCADTEQFTLAGCVPRPFEQLQFLRGTEHLFLDLMWMPAALHQFIKEMHEFYCELLELWAAKTDVDALFFMDDWGTQKDLLIDPVIWRAVFKPLYKDYINIAHAHGKKAFMHSDGCILKIYPDLIELGLDALNSQIFCMGIENVKPFAGKITFWGEIDRQHLLPHGSQEDIDKAVRRVYENLWFHGGCIAQCEFGPGARIDNVRQVYAAWTRIHSLPAAHAAAHQ